MAVVLPVELHCCSKEITIYYALTCHSAFNVLHLDIVTYTGQNLHKLG